jgi:predicted nucleotidyltransferase
MHAYEWHDLEDFSNIHAETEGFLGFRKDFDTENAKNKKRYWLFSVDIAEGSGGDYSIINVFEVLPMDHNDIKNSINPGAMYDFFKIEQVALFRSNEHTIEDFSKILYTLALEVFHGENVKMVIEYNTYGSILLKYLSTIFPARNEFEDEMVLRFKHRHDSKVIKHGLKLNSANKAVFCQNFKKLVESNRVQINEFETVTESSVFGSLKNGSYGAQLGHDDIIMSCVNSTEFFNTTAYADYIEELLDIIPHETVTVMEEILFKDNTNSGDLQYDIYDII